MGAAMTVRVMLVSPARSAALREVRFDDEGPLDETGVRRARNVAGALPGADRCLTSPAPRCRETAAALGLRATPEPLLSGWDLGEWRGRTLQELSGNEPQAVATWLSDPCATPHGGESLRAFRDRIAGWLAGPGAGGVDRAGEGSAARVLAIADPAVVRIAVVHALDLGTEAFWRLDVAPLALTELSGRAGRWNLRCGRPLAS